MADARNALAQAMFGVGGGRKHKPQLSKIIFDKHDTNKDGKIDAGAYASVLVLVYCMYRAAAYR